MLGLNVQGQRQLPGQVQQVELLEQDRITVNDALLRNVRRKHLGLIASHYFMGFVGVGMSTLSLWLTFGFASASMYGFLLVSLVVLGAVLGYVYYFISKPLFYTVLGVLIAAFIIAFDLLP